MSNVFTPDDLRKLLATGEHADEIDAIIRDAMGGATRVQGLTDRCELARIVATRSATTARNKAVRNDLAADKGAEQHWLGVTNRLFTGDAVKPVTAAYHAARELLTVGKATHEDGTPANQSSVNFGLGKWDNTWTVTSRARHADLEMAFNDVRAAMERGKQEVRDRWADIQHDAEYHLGDLYDPSMFPDCEQWLNGFTLRLEIIDLPTFDMRVDMDKHARKDLVMQTRKATMDRIAKQMVGAWSRNAEVFRNSVQYVQAVLASDSVTVKRMNNQPAAKTERKSPIATSLLPNLQGQAALTLGLARAAEDVTLQNFISEVASPFGWKLVTEGDTLRYEGGITADKLQANPDLRDTLAQQLGRVLGNHGDAVVEQAHEQAQAALDEVGVSADDDLLDFS